MTHFVIDETTTTTTTKRQNGIKEMAFMFTWFHGIGYVDKNIVTAV